MRVLVVGEIFSENLGDGAIFDCIEWLFGASGAQIVPLDLSQRPGWAVVHSNHAATQNRLRQAAQNLARRSRSVRRLATALRWYTRDRKHATASWTNAIAEVDAVIVGGGQLLTDRDFGFPPRIYEISRIAHAQEKPVAFFGVGASDWGPAARRLYRRALSRAVYISTRDQRSADIVARALPREQLVSVHPDPVFALPSVRGASPVHPRTGIAAINLQSSDHFRPRSSRTRGVSEEEYASFWMRVLRYLDSRFEATHILTNGDRSDHAAAQSIAQRATAEGLAVELRRRPTSPEHLDEQYRVVDKLICTRMHAGIIAHSLGAEVITIAWDAKVEAVWSEAGLPQVVLPPEVILGANPSCTVTSDSLEMNGRIPAAAALEVRIRKEAEKCLERLTAVP